MMKNSYGSGRLRSFITVSLLLMVASVVLTSCSIGSMGASTGTTTTGLVASNAGNAGKNCMHIGVLLPDVTSSTRWDQNDRPALKQEIQKAVPGSTVDEDNANGDSVLQYNQAKADLSKGDCMLVVAPHDSVAAASIVELAKSQNVPVIAYDRLIQSKDLSYYVSFDNVKVGELQADYIIQQMGDATNVKMAMISGSQTDANALLFSIGVHNVLDPLFADKRYTTSDEVFTPDWNPINALSEATSILASNRDIQVFYVANDDMAASVIKALQAAKITQPVIVTGQDATAGGVRAILLGQQGMTVYKPIIQEADSVGQLVKAIHDGSSTRSLTNGQVIATYDNGSIPSILDAPISVDKTNVKKNIIDSGFLKASDICINIPAGTDTDGIC